MRGYERIRLDTNDTYHRMIFFCRQPLILEWPQLTLVKSSAFLALKSTWINFGADLRSTLTVTWQKQDTGHIWTSLDISNSWLNLRLSQRKISKQSGHFVEFLRKNTKEPTKTRKEHLWCHSSRRCHGQPWPIKMGRRRLPHGSRLSGQRPRGLSTPWFSGRCLVGSSVMK